MKEITKGPIKGAMNETLEEIRSSPRMQAWIESAKRVYGIKDGIKNEIGKGVSTNYLNADGSVIGVSTV